MVDEKLLNSTPFNIFRYNHNSYKKYFCRGAFFCQTGENHAGLKNRYGNIKWQTIFLAILLLLKRLIPSTTSTPRDGLPECMGQGTWTLSMIARLLKTCTENTAKAWQKMKREPKARSLMHSGWWGNISSSNIQAWNSLVSALRSLGTSISSTFHNQGRKDAQLWNGSNFQHGLQPFWRLLRDHLCLIQL